MSPASLLALQRHAGNAAVSAALRRTVQRAPETFEPGQNRYTEAQIRGFVDEKTADAAPVDLDAVEREFKDRFPYHDHRDVALMRRHLRGLPGQAPVTPLPMESPVFSSEFDAHLNGGHFANGGAATTSINRKRCPPASQE